MPTYRIKPGYKFGSGRGGDTVELTEHEAAGQECRLELVEEGAVLGKVAETEETAAAPAAPAKPVKPVKAKPKRGR